MTEEFRKAVYDLIYLSSCAIHGTIPEKERAEQMDLDQLYKAADYHMMTAIAAMALERAGVKNDAFTQATGKAIRNAALFDIERAAVQEKLEEAGIWYMPLKGAVLKDLYPAVGMRQMSDVDILIDETRVKDVRKIMEELGFKHAHRNPIHDDYHKLPVCNFEMHYRLFSSRSDPFYSYYKGIDDKLIKDENKNSGYHFCFEDFYIYMIAHEYSHYLSRGTGLRPILDVFVFCEKYSHHLDWAYIEEELNKLGIAQFERKQRSLAYHLFDGAVFTEDLREMLEQAMSSGLYGPTSEYVNRRVEDLGGGTVGKFRYLFKRIFIPMDTIRGCYPFFSRFPIFLPVFPVYRLIQALTVKKHTMKVEINVLFKTRKSDQ